MEAADPGGEGAEEEPGGCEPAVVGEYSTDQSQQVLHGGGPECGRLHTSSMPASLHCTNVHVNVHTCTCTHTCTCKCM